MGAKTSCLTVVLLRGGTMHGVFCDAFLRHGGFIAISGELYEILTVAPDEGRADADAWVTRRAEYKGAA